MKDPEDYWGKAIGAMMHSNPGDLEKLWEITTEELTELINQFSSGSCQTAADYVQSLI
jgi:hypothetical protein